MPRHPRSHGRPPVILLPLLNLVNKNPYSVFHMTDCECNIRSNCVKLRENGEQRALVRAPAAGLGGATTAEAARSCSTSNGSPPRPASQGSSAQVASGGQSTEKVRMAGRSAEPAAADLYCALCWSSCGAGCRVFSGGWPGFAPYPDSSSLSLALGQRAEVSRGSWNMVREKETEEKLISTPDYLMQLMNNKKLLSSLPNFCGIFNHRQRLLEEEIIRVQKDTCNDILNGSTEKRSAALPDAVGRIVQLQENFIYL